MPALGETVADLRAELGERDAAIAELTTRAGFAAITFRRLGALAFNNSQHSLSASVRKEWEAFAELCRDAEAKTRSVTG